MHRKNEIFVKYAGNTTRYEVTPTTTVAQLKEMIGEEGGLAQGHTAEALDLVWGGRRLDDSATLAQSSLQDGTSVQLVLHVKEEKKWPTAQQPAAQQPREEGYVLILI